MNTSTDKQTLTPLNTETALPIMGTNMHAIALHKLSYMIIIAMLVTLIFSSEALLIWAEKLPFTNGDLITSENLEPNLTGFKNLLGLVLDIIEFSFLNPFTETLFGAVQWWHDLMEQNGLTIVFDKLREAFRFFQSYNPYEN